MKLFQSILFLVLASMLLSSTAFAPEQALKIALLKYRGGGDWYANPTSLPNLAKFCNKEMGMNIETNIPTVDVGSSELYNYPFVHITGHGNIIFSNEEAMNLRNYLIGGGFLHISDNYGLDPFIRPAMKKVFPEADFIELPFSHPIYHQRYEFSNGLPKIHEHDGKAAQGFGILWEGKLCCFYDFQCDLGDAWENPEVHRDPEEKRLAALKMGANIIQYAFAGR